MLLRLLGIAVVLGVATLMPCAASETLSVAVDHDFVAPATSYDSPDLAPYTVANVRTRLPSESTGAVAIIATDGVRLLSEAFRGRRGEDLQRRQGRAETHAIAVTDGAVTLDELVEQLADPEVASVEAGVVTLRLPVLVRPGATLVIDGERTPVVRLSTDRGAFLANAGTLFVVGTEVVGWDEAENQPSRFVNKKRFRPFLASYVRSTTHLAGSRFAHLGFAEPTAYGISLSTQPERQHGEPTEDAPTGQIIDCDFDGLFYGFYSYEARDVAIVGNTYTDSIVYGIDPHDRSTRLLIARNTTTGTREKHGIIGSRGVSDSWIIDNVSYANHGSGVMLDRQCSGNVIANNRVYENGQGVAIYESPDNLLADNLIVGNAKSAIRIRNSTDQRVVGNTLVRNGDFAVEVASKRLDDHEKRFERGDTYEVGVSATLFDNHFSENRGFAEATGLGELTIAGVHTDVDLKQVEDRLGKPLAPARYTGGRREFGGDLKPIRGSLDPAFEDGGPALHVTGQSVLEPAH